MEAPRLRQANARLAASTEPCPVYESGATVVDMGMVLAGGSGGRNLRAPVSRFQVVSGTGL